MKSPQWLKPGATGAVVGGIAVAIVGFSWGGWVTAGSAQALSNTRSAAAVAQALTPYCVDRSAADPRSVEVMAELKAASAYSRRGVVEKAGWATALGTSRRSFTRLFKSETSLSFVDWRQQACILVALPRLVGGEAVTTVALDLGYDNPAAFTAMFKRILGSSPRADLGSSARVKSSPLVPVTTSSSGNL